MREEPSGQSLVNYSSSRALELKKIVKALSTTSSNPVLPPSHILALLEQATPPQIQPENTDQYFVSLYENDLYWLLVSKATVQIYGLLLESLFWQIIPPNEHIWYWDKVLGSYTHLCLFAIQTSPLRLWSWSKEVYFDAKCRLSKLTERSELTTVGEVRSDFFSQWKWLYNLVTKSIRKKSFQDLQQGVLSPLALYRKEARCSQLKLKRLREMGASGLGVLIVDGLNFDNDNDYSIVKKVEDIDSNKWRIIIERSVTLMDNVLKNVLALEMGVIQFEEKILTNVSNDLEISEMEGDEALVARPARLSRRLQNILKFLIPKHKASTQSLVRQYGRPSRLVRFWLPTCALLISTPFLQHLFGKREAAKNYVQNSGATARDFYLNWVLKPVKKVISTIRHDQGSELAIMSKESLSGDRDSLERMVIDFAIDNSNSTDRNYALTESQISEIRAKVREGDLTPVLRAYEKDLRNPLRGTLRGDLVRALLIQVQKTKVDVEIALNGIDALLKSQELVFGFVGLTPGLAICFGIFRYLRQVIRNMMGLRNHHKAGQMIRILRNINRILTVATPIQNNIISYKDYGLLLCEVHRLRRHAHKLFPTDIEREFLEDITDLCNVNGGLSAQLNALKRIRWDYGKWIN